MILNSWMHVKLDDFEVTDRARFFSRYQPRFQIVDYLALEIRRYELGSIYPTTQSNIAEDFILKLTVAHLLKTNPVFFTEYKCYSSVQNGTPDLKEGKKVQSCLSNLSRHIGGKEVQLHSFLNSALDGGEQLTLFRES